jgi:hypothetical protein
MASFPSQRFPSEISVYRPPQAVSGPIVTKLASCDDIIAALSSNGEVFTFTSPSDGEGESAKSSSIFKPQRVWALRRQFSAVQVSELRFKRHGVSCLVGRRHWCRRDCHSLYSVRSCLHPLAESYRRSGLRCQNIQISAHFIYPARCCRLREQYWGVWCSAR